MDSLLEERERTLAGILAGHRALVVAYSGGVDSSYLLAVAVEVLGERALAATAVSPSLPAGERADAAALAARLGVRHVEVVTDEADRPEYRRNDPDRCFHCKSALFDVLEPLAARFAEATIAVGTVTDDLGDHRPGQRAARDRGVATPLADAGLGKDDVRELSRRRGLPTWDKPAAACLASRVVYGLQVTPGRLSRIERAEAWLRSRLGAHANLRVRDHGEVARVEVDRHLLEPTAMLADELAALLHELGWRYATLDLAGFRSGSLNVGLQPRDHA
ncbi:MAG TPA: ATP-dependent sacrificial sulfur transferase LarE [Egibacteraceae bacterium]|nr:ATP-dependent sacrificial sulfur transferase LarE [Egibacteraceae bacterium]